MKIVIAPDSFKESMTAMEVAQAVEKGIKNSNKNIETVKIPLADGGEGTVDALVNSLKGSIMTHTVTDPLGNQIEAYYGIVNDKTAVIEIATVVGLDLVPREKRNPLKTTTYGIGELLVHALDQGIRHFIIGLGGSSTNDGGIGMLQALGVEISNRQGQAVSRGAQGLNEISHIRLNRMDKRLQDCIFEVASDVTNPLVGPNGASFVYGPQKGADTKMVKQLDTYMEHYATIIQRDVQMDVKDIPGAGAAGGLGAACFAFLNATLRSGIDIVMEATQLASEIKTADVVITGEGKMDDQTVYGKTPAGVAKIAKQYDVPVIAITGANKVTTSKLYEAGITAIFSIVNGPMSLETAMKNSKQLTEQTAENVMRLIWKSTGGV